jgi:hypothetical protein
MVCLNEVDFGKSGKGQDCSVDRAKEVRPLN